MLGFTKNMFILLLCVCTLARFSRSLSAKYKEPIKCVYLTNRPCQARPTFVNINFDETFFYPFTVSVNKCDRSCNTIDDPYAHVCVVKK